MNRATLFALASSTHTAPRPSRATSPSPLRRVGTSNAVISAPGRMLTRLLAFCKVAHTVPCGSTATPNGPTLDEPNGEGGPTGCRVNTPSLRRVTLTPGGSANQTAPSGETARGPSLAIDVDRGKDVIAPSGETREIARACAFVYHTYPSASTARPSGSGPVAPGAARG